MRHAARRLDREDADAPTRVDEPLVRLELREAHEQRRAARPGMRPIAPLDKPRPRLERQHVRLAWHKGREKHAERRALSGDDADVKDVRRVEVDCPRGVGRADEVGEREGDVAAAKGVVLAAT